MEQPKIALITGANRGLGLETARQLARLGCQVILTSRSEPDGQAAVDALRADGLQADFQRLDVSDPASIESTKDMIMNKFDRLDILVNNAGIYIDRGQPALMVDEDIVQ